MTDVGPEGKARGPLTREVEIVNKLGLHARAAMKFVQTAERYNAAVTVTRGGEKVDGTSILDLLMLAAGQGVTITISAEGPQAADAIEALAQLAASRFGEDE